jgi:hypothetical protein
MASAATLAKWTLAIAGIAAILAAFAIRLLYLRRRA